MIMFPYVSVREIQRFELVWILSFCADDKVILESKFIVPTAIYMYILHF